MPNTPHIYNYIHNANSIVCGTCVKGYMKYINTMYKVNY